MATVDCIIGPGMFSDEAIVEVLDLRGNRHVLFVPEEFIQGVNLLKVEVLDSGSLGVLIKLPRETNHNLRTLVVCPEAIT